MIVKVLALSQFRYLSKVIIIPENIIAEIQKSVFEFIWGGKQHKAKRNVIVQDNKYGGLRMEYFS